MCVRVFAALKAPWGQEIVNSWKILEGIICFPPNPYFSYPHMCSAGKHPLLHTHAHSLTGLLKRALTLDPFFKVIY